MNSIQDRRDAPVEPPPDGHGERGIVLIFFSMVLLIIMTMVGVMSSQTTVLDERIVGNTRDRHLAFQAAEVALDAAEKYIEDEVLSTNAFDTDGSDGLYDNSLEDIWEEVDWDSSDISNTYEAITYTAFDASHNVNTAPKYVIQHVGSIASTEDTLNLDNYGAGTGSGSLEIFRITVRGTGGSDSAVVYLQSVYGKQI